MVLDALLKLCAAQQVTADAVSGNVIDTGNTTPKRKVAAGERLAVVIALTAVGTNTGSAKVQVIQSAATNLGTPGIIGEVDLLAADLVAGKIVVVPLGLGPAALRYLGLNFDITGTVDFTVDAYLVPFSMASTLAESYAKGYAV